MTALSRQSIAPIEPAAVEGIYANPMVCALAEPIEPVRLGLLYHAGLLLVTVMMLLLPLVYIALVAGAAYLVYLHAIYDTFIIGGRGRIAILRLFVYAAPILIGAILVLFMIKPPRARQHHCWRRWQASVQLRRRLKS